MPRPGRRTGAGTARALALLVALSGASLAVASPASSLGSLGSTHPPGPPPARSTTGAPDAALHLVTLRGPGRAGLAARVGARDALVVPRLMAEQDRTLAAVGAPTPVYRWTTALNGYAVPLTPAQAATLRTLPAVALVERSTVRPLASLGEADPPGTVAGSRGRGGAGVVVGLVDSGLAPEGPLFARTPQLGRRATDFRGACAPGEGASLCNGKVLGARWFVDGYGAAAVRSSASMSARDDDGHGTQVASIAAGNAGVDVRVRGQRLGRFSGVAPQARLAVYKACWTAPDPRDDGCATADLVAAIDAATRDGVDVLNLSVGGPARLDTVDLALLGAAEADIVVTAASGNDGGTLAHQAPWVTTVGGTPGPQRRGVVVLGDGREVQGAMMASRTVPAVDVVLAAQARAAGESRAAARTCTPGSLDAARVAGRIVVCDRGGVGRVDKSAAVGLADGVGMVLVNLRRGSTDADFHVVPTVHLDRADGRAVKRWLARHPDARVSLRPSGVEQGSSGVVRFAGAGLPDTGLLKPDVVAPAVGVLGAVPPAGGPEDGAAPWDLLTGTSASSAAVAGAAAVVLGQRDWSATEARSALVTSATRVRGAALTRSGAGVVDPWAAVRPGLVHPLDPADYRAWLADRSTDLNTPSIVVPRGAVSATRTVTNTGTRALYFSSRARGLARRVLVSPAALRLAPGESGTYTVQVLRRGPGLRGAGARLDDGFVVWRGATGTVTRVPVLVR